MHVTNRSVAVCFVNFYTADLMEHQIDYYSRILSGRKIQLIVVDNSRNSEINRLKNFADSRDMCDHVKFIDNSGTDLIGSYAHAEGLDLAVSSSDDFDYYIFQDPDFFWLSDNIFSLIDYCENNNTHAIGSPYRRRVGYGAPDFPCAWGCVYKSDVIRGVSFSVDQKGSINFPNTQKFRMPEFEFSGDVGWQIRNVFDKNRLYCSFSQRPAILLKQSFGDHSFESSPVEYYFNGSLIGLHLFRGSFPTSVELLKNDNTNSVNKDWLITKLKYTKFSKNYLNSRFFRLNYFWENFIHSMISSINREEYFAYHFLVQKKKYHNVFEFLRIALISLRIAISLNKDVRAARANFNSMTYEKFMSMYLNDAEFVEKFNKVNDIHFNDDGAHKLREILNSSRSLSCNEFLNSIFPRLLFKVKTEQFILKAIEGLNILNFLNSFKNYDEAINYAKTQFDHIRIFPKFVVDNFLLSCKSCDDTIISQFRKFYDSDILIAFPDIKNNWWMYDKFERLFDNSDFISDLNSKELRLLIDFNRFILDFLSFKYK